MMSDIKLPYYLNCKKLSTSITRARNMLIKKVNKTGIYENFGQEELRYIKDKFIDFSDYSEEMNKKRLMLDSFEYWCSNYSINK